MDANTCYGYTTNFYGYSVTDNPKQPVKVCDVFTPATYAEAFTCPEQKEWKKAIQTEYDNMTNNSVWKLIPRPKGKISTITTKMVFKVKSTSTGTVEKFKVRICARGFNMIQGYNYKETFSPTLSASSMRTLLFLISAFGLIARHADISAAFLSSKVDFDNIYLELPEGFQEFGHSVHLEL